MRLVVPVVGSWVLVIVLVLIGGYDFCVVVYGWDGGRTISSQVHELSRRFPVVPVFVGLVLGHLFWPIGRPAKGGM